TCTSAHSPRHTHSGGNSARAYCGRVDSTLRTQGNAPDNRSAAERGPPQDPGRSRCPCALRNNRRNALPSNIHCGTCAFHRERAEALVAYCEGCRTQVTAHSEKLADVRDGSLADMPPWIFDVPFTPETGH